jgi:hypothetical protein
MIFCAKEHCPFQNMPPFTWAEFVLAGAIPSHLGQTTLMLCHLSSCNSVSSSFYQCTKPFCISIWLLIAIAQTAPLNSKIAVTLHSSLNSKIEELSSTRFVVKSTLRHRERQAS